MSDGLPHYLQPLSHPPAALCRGRLPLAQESPAGSASCGAGIDLFLEIVCNLHLQEITALIRSCVGVAQEGALPSERFLSLPRAGAGEQGSAQPGSLGTLAPSALAPAPSSPVPASRVP